MDHHDTEDFPRRLTDAQERALALREQAMDDAWSAMVRAVRGWIARLTHRHRDEMLHEA